MSLLLKGFPCGSFGKESACNEGDLGLISGLERSPGGGKGYPLHFWPRESHGLYSPRGHKESDMTERFALHFTLLAVLRKETFKKPCPMDMRMVLLAVLKT